MKASLPSVGQAVRCLHRRPPSCLAVSAMALPLAGLACICRRPSRAFPVGRSYRGPSRSRGGRWEGGCRSVAHACRFCPVGAAAGVRQQPGPGCAPSSLGLLSVSLTPGSCVCRSLTKDPGLCRILLSPRAEAARTRVGRLAMQDSSPRTALRPSSPWALGSRIRALVTDVGTALQRLLSQPRECFGQSPVLKPRVSSRLCVCEPP